MGACCGKPDRKSGGNVLGGVSSNAQASASVGVRKTNDQSTQSARPQKPSTTGGQTLGNQQSSSRADNDLSPSALAAMKRAQEAENRGVQGGGGKLSKKLAENKKKSPYAVEESMPEPTNAQWN